MVGSVAGSARSTTVTSQDHIDFFWRPGCGFCMSLERRLKNAGVTFKKHNIWENKRDRAFVKSVAHGNETVPTLRIGSKSLVNPSLSQVLQAMKSEVPHLVPRK
ncbi:NrdH-redoxin [bacterium]|nr:NrdH-redoxin [bacterium]